MIKKSQSAALMGLCFIAFIALGLPDGLFGVAWPSIRIKFNLDQSAMGLPLVLGTIGYMISSFFSGAIVKKWGVGFLLSASCLATSITLFMYSFSPYWLLYASFGLLGGLGAGAIDAGINSFVEKNYSHSIMQWLHSTFGIGITLGPFIMTLCITHNLGWERGYIIVSLFQLFLSVLFAATAKFWPRSEESSLSQSDKDKANVIEKSMKETMKNYRVWLSAFLFFLYTGTELGIGLWAYSYLTEYRHISIGIAGSITGLYWGMFTLGRIMGGLFGFKFSTGFILKGSLILAIFSTLFLLQPFSSILSFVGIALIGFSIAPIFPALVSDTVNRVGEGHTENAIGIELSFAGFGASILPGIVGFLTKAFGLGVFPIVVLATFVILLLFYLQLHAYKPEKIKGH